MTLYAGHGNTLYSPITIISIDLLKWNVGLSSEGNIFLQRRHPLVSSLPILSNLIYTINLVEDTEEFTTKRISNHIYFDPRKYFANTGLLVKANNMLISNYVAQNKIPANYVAQNKIAAIISLFWHVILFVPSSNLKRNP